VKEERKKAYEELIRLECQPLRTVSDDALTSKEAGLLADVKTLAMDIQAGWIDSGDAAATSFYLLRQLGLTGWEQERRQRRRCA